LSVIKRNSKDRTNYFPIKGGIKMDKKIIVIGGVAGGLAEYLDVPVPTIRDWRTDGKGPCAIRVGGRVRFAVSDVLRWLAQQRETEPGRAPTGR